MQEEILAQGSFYAPTREKLMANRRIRSELEEESRALFDDDRIGRRQRLVAQIAQLMARIWLQRRRESQIKSSTSDSTTDKAPG